EQGLEVRSGTDNGSLRVPDAAVTRLQSGFIRLDDGGSELELHAEGLSEKNRETGNRLARVDAQFRGAEEATLQSLRIGGLGSASHLFGSEQLGLDPLPCRQFVKLPQNLPLIGMMRQVERSAVV